MRTEQSRDKLKFILVQARKDQQMKLHEISCFETSGGLSDGQVTSHDLLELPLDPESLGLYDGVIIVGSGDHSVLDDVPNLKSLEEFVLEAKSRDLPVLGASWGAQFLAKVFGGRVVHDPERREVGSVEIFLVPAAADDALFRGLPPRFWAQTGHKDRVAVLPEGALLLASSEACQVQAFTFPQSGVYGIQFHPELAREDMVLRLRYYQESYLRGRSVEDVIGTLKETSEAGILVGKWVDQVVMKK